MKYLGIYECDSRSSLPADMATIKLISVNSPLLKVGCTLGEGDATTRSSWQPWLIDVIPKGPLYDPATSTLHFVDISQNRVNALPVSVSRADQAARHRFIISTRPI